MPGPGFDLMGEEELAEVGDVINSGRLSRFGSDGDTFPAKVRHFEEAVAEQAGVKHALAVDAGMLPRTDALLARSMSFGIGVVDPDLAPLGLRMRDDSEIARRRAERFISVYRTHTV